MTGSDMTQPRRARSLRSRSSTSRHSGETPLSRPAGQRASPSGSRASRCAAARCSTRCCGSGVSRGSWRSPCRRPCGWRVAGQQRRSGAELALRRATIVARVREVAPLEFVKGGGTGSVKKTAAEDAVRDRGGLWALPPGAVRQLPQLSRPADGAFRAAHRPAARRWSGHRAWRRLPRVRAGQREQAAAAIPARGTAPR